MSPCVSLSLQCLMGVFSALLQLDRGAVVHSNEQVRPSGRSSYLCGTPEPPESVGDVFIFFLSIHACFFLPFCSKLV